MTTFHIPPLSQEALREDLAPSSAPLGDLKAHTNAVPTSVRAVVPMPYVIELGHLRDGRLRLQASIKVQVAKAGDGITAYAESLNEYGYGDDSQAAVADLQGAIAELYFTLKSAQDKLGNDLHRTWQSLSQLVAERR
jgi:hypothetical protein